MAAQKIGIVTSVKHVIVEAIKGTEEIASTIAGAVNDAMVSVLKGTTEVSTSLVNAISEVVRGVFQAVVKG